MDEVRERGRKRFRESGLTRQDVVDGSPFKNLDSLKNTSWKGVRGAMLKMIMNIVYYLFGMLDENGKKK